MGPKIEYLIVDTTAFIKNAPLHELASEIFTIQEVVNEITNVRQLKKLVVLPYDLKIKDVFQENIKFITEFSKKTGDYPSLSATDIKVMALAYQIEKEKVGTDHLKTEPHIKRVLTFQHYLSQDEKNLTAGFYIPEKKVTDAKSETFDAEENELLEKLESLNCGECDDLNVDDILIPVKDNVNADNLKIVKDCDRSDDEYLTAEDDSEEENNEEYGEEHSDEEVNEVEKVDNKESEEHNVEEENEVEKVDDEKKGDEEGDECEDDYDEYDDEDDSGWITPQNIAHKKHEITLETIDVPLTVACITSDFAIQNVLKHIGLNVLSDDGRQIHQLRSFILRCYACFKTTSIMTKVFCPKCGNKTLKRVAVSLKEDGTQLIHLSKKVRLTGRGKKFSIPKPKGGRHANNPILCEDQRIPEQKQPKLALKKNNPLDPEYVYGYSPFVIRDTNSRAAMLGIRTTNLKTLIRDNPNTRRNNKKK